ncbi:MAG: glycosyltransferase, partial [Chloroflexota bacterium]|nr:glycosyltransferase [Chloroflexota bacterium]
LTDRVACVSQLVADFAVEEVGIPRHKIVVIPNGIDAQAFEHLPAKPQARARLGLPLNSTLVGTVARLNPVKRLDVLLQATALMNDVHVVIVGAGPEWERLKTLRKQLGLADRVHLAGQQSNVPEWLAALDLFALTSDWEGMSNALLEAMAAGLPVVATAVGGTPEVVVDGETGFLVPPRDPNALAQAIIRLLRDPDLRHQMGEAGRARVAAHFSVEQMVRKTEALYEKLLAEKGLA